MLNDEFLRHLETQLHLIALDCFDLKAKERLRSLVDEIKRRLTVPPIILTKRYNDPDIAGQ